MAHRQIANAAERGQKTAIIETAKRPNSNTLRAEKRTLSCASRFVAQHEIDTQKVKDYVRDMLDGAAFPPIRVAKYDNSYLIIDGHHRVSAARAAQKPIAALVVEGEIFDALDRKLIDEDRDERADDEKYWEIAE